MGYHQTRWPEAQRKLVEIHAQSKAVARLRCEPLLAAHQRCVQKIPFDSRDGFRLFCDEFLQLHNQCYDREWKTACPDMLLTRKINVLYGNNPEYTEDMAAEHKKSREYEEENAPFLHKMLSRVEKYVRDYPEWEHHRPRLMNDSYSLMKLFARQDYYKSKGFNVDSIIARDDLTGHEERKVRQSYAPAVNNYANKKGVPRTLGEWNDLHNKYRLLRREAENTSTFREIFGGGGHLSHMDSWPRHFFQYAFNKERFTRNSKGLFTEVLNRYVGEQPSVAPASGITRPLNFYRGREGILAEQAAVEEE